MDRNRLPLLLGLLLSFALADIAHLGAAEGTKPNVLVILADDLGYADTGFQGCVDIPTPHLDRLATAGVRCTNGYVTHPFCSPTRAALMTGRYQHRFGHENNPFYDPNDHREGLPLSEKLLPEYLRSAGYATGWIGKWHLGAAPEFHPLRRGFTETFGFLGGGHTFLRKKVDSTIEYQIPIERNGQPVEITDHLTLDFGREGAAFVRRHASEPWFLYLAFNAPHNPQEPTPERLAQFESIADKKRRGYAAQVSLMDDAIGNVLSAMRATGQERRTLVFFLSDNGGPITLGSPNGSRNTPLRGGKGELYEGGVRVPFLVSWPDKLPQGSTYDLPVSSLDVFATALPAAGVPMPPKDRYDGVDLLPFLNGANPHAPHDRLFWRMGSAQWAARGDTLKQIRFRNGKEEFYDLADDIAETKNVANVREKEAKALSADLDAWDKTLVAPAFPGLAGRPEAQAKAKDKKTKAARRKALVEP